MFVMLFDFSGVSKFFSALLVLLSINFCFAENFEISSKSGVLLYWEGERASFFNSKILYRNNKNFQNELNFLKINSDMSWFSTNISKINYYAKFDFNILKPQISGGLLRQTEIEILSGDTKITNDGAKGFYIGSSLSFDIGKFEIIPSVLFAKGKFGKGDFNYFYGKPDVQKFLHLGLSLEYEKTQKVNFLYENFNLNVLNNNEVRLFSSNNYILGTNYKYSFYLTKLQNFYGILGINYVNLSATGSLTPANQQYFLFPYAFFDITGNAYAFAAWTAISFDIQNRYLKHGFRIGTGNVFSGEINANIHYKYRKFFGKEEINENVDVELKNTGIVFLSYSCESPDLYIKNKVFICFGLQKSAPCYIWGIDKFTQEKVDSDGYVDYKDLAKTFLLSGLSGYLRIAF